MTPLYREYRRNWLVRRAVNTLAFWTTKEGFDTKLELTVKQKGLTKDQEDRLIEPYSYVKDYVDDVNTTVNLDDALRTAQIKRSIFGRSAFEIEGTITNPTRLIPLDSTLIEPLIDKNWYLKGYSYAGQGSLISPYYLPNEVLYFTLNDFEGDLKGLSDIEPIVPDCTLYDKIIREDLTEALTVLWAGIVLYLLDRSKLGTISDAKVQEIINDFVAMIKPGKSIAAENVWSAQVIDVHPDLAQILQVMDNIERGIVGCLGVPRYMLNLKVEGWSRANAYAELESFVDGTVTDAQRSLRRQVEAQWYTPLIQTRIARKEAKLLRPVRYGQKIKLPIRLLHVWRETRTADWFELFRVVTIGNNGNTGWISEEKAYEIMTKGKSTDFSQEAYERSKQISIIDMPVPQGEKPLITSKQFDTKSEALSAIESLKEMDWENIRVVDLTEETPVMSGAALKDGVKTVTLSMIGSRYLVTYQSK